MSKKVLDQHQALHLTQLKSNSLIFLIICCFLYKKQTKDEGFNLFT